ncbi:hypothetical protein C343_06232 [Cryptococcus neoformans C23]|uniref:Alpha-1,3-mannosyltransferase n=3 Tax=Cryptococcus neoformans TaxID=5207 RepID=A0A854Q3M2_CRYNE|nr:hypothetical protein CNAG_06016 [Cryptococcus neoformans var. grubii H99]AUB28373.1 hypothetical protein CKF44_06016 [Cryptococcus neoformans var. grubii]OWZ27392.1 hypothetical protein C347_06232 [Cryptococcus neoformans var. grubii AD2-60a]OWZ29964.1 hypothetical protein C353_06251 [Cryptococcus neoformans var. grubii AD1-83a]OWZ39453.1 hypothetical protein C343_06232 [Cryptococcus neoformans var. grubii C23]OWZ54574.1 hypothetical protein C368_03213 [Cryptococcus neoformans var. grubii 1|eukprot:XP_012053086.1 hypothetical protein CNAG_06016 [Cryptococcus neoformans var. grubii H99]
MPPDIPKRKESLPQYISSQRAPHIRTPLSSSSFFNTNFKVPGRNMSNSRLRISLSKPLVRVLLIGSLLISLVLLSRIGNREDDGAWDASSWSDRHGGGRTVSRGQRKGWSLWNNTPKIRTDQRIPRPILTRQNATLPPPTHPGRSRRLKPGSDPENPEYIEGPLPTLDEAWEFLHPLLREIKSRTPSVPREHELTEPIFPPFLRDDLKERYRHLRDVFDEETGEWVRGPERRWFLVTVCRQVAGMLADWFAAWTVLADFLGPESLVFSLFEGDSADGSGEILAYAMRAHLLNIGVPPSNIHIQTQLPAVDWDNHHRIELLAEMRNSGMQPFYDTAATGLSPDGHSWTGIVFYNDVYLSATHFLELMHQHLKQDADMTCGWDHAGKWFYDGWVARDMSGDLFTPFPVREEDKDLPQKLFPSSPETLKRYNRLLPFQAFAAWNGITVMSPEPFLPPYNVRFRRGTPRTDDFWECQASESSFISWDFWKYGFGRIAVVPGVHATYGKGDAMLRGWVEWPSEEDSYGETIWWDPNPPHKIRCHDWPDKLGKGYWAWDTVRWVKPPKLEIPSASETTVQS